MAFVLVNFSWAFRADRRIPNVANLSYGRGTCTDTGPAALVVLFVLLITVLHGDPLQPSALTDRRRGLLYCQPVPNGLVGFAVQGGVQHALQSEIPVRFLKRREVWGEEETAQSSGCPWLPGFATGASPCPCVPMSPHFGTTTLEAGMELSIRHAEVEKHVEAV